MVLTPRARFLWRVRNREIALGERTLLMAILNLTPDSFSDGGRYAGPSLALTRGLLLLDTGADILDLGGESTRPNATALAAEEEQQRLLPVLQELRRARPSALLSVDTYHAATARRALDLGADIINDVSGLLWDPAMPAVLAAAAPAPGLVLMHTRDRPGEWGALPSIPAAEVAALVRGGLRERLVAAAAAGIALETVVLDPGFGFGKRGAENDALLAGLGSLESLGRPLVIGLSRKGFLARGDESGGTPDDAWRLGATTAGNTAAALGGAHILRVHNLPAARAAAAVADRLLAQSELSAAEAGGSLPSPSSL